MNKLHLLLVSACCSFAFAANAQNTNTDIGIFESRTGVAIVKAFGQVGSVVAGPVEISVNLKETTDVSIGQKAYGLAVEIASDPARRDRVFVDDGEIDPLLTGMNYLIKIGYDVTTLPGFEASYTTKAGLRVTANSIRKDGGIQYAIQSGNTPRVLLTSLQMTQLYNLVEQARKNLESLKAGN